MATERPKLTVAQPIFEIRWRRRRAFFRFLFNLLVSVTSLAAAGALGLARERQVVDATLLQVGIIIALAACALFAGRALFSLFSALFRATEEAQFFKKGFTWNVGRQKHRYPWAAVRRYRLGARTLRVLGLPIRRVGAHELTMRDGTVFRVSWRLTNPAAFDAAVGPLIAELMGQRIAKALREDQIVRLADDLALNKRGIKVGRHPISWARMDVQRNGSQVAFKMSDKAGKFKTVWQIPVYRLDNLDGFLEVTAATLRNHQPERFTTKTQELGAGSP